MEFSKKYISKTDKAFDMTSEKKVISDDFFALGEVIDNLIIEIKSLRGNLK